MSTIEERVSASNLQLIPEVLLPSQLTPRGTISGPQRLAMAVMHDLVRLAEKYAHKLATGQRISTAMHKQALQDLVWINEDRGPFPFSVCVELLTGPDANDAVEVWRKRLTDALSGRLQLDVRRLSRDAGSQAPRPTQIRVKGKKDRS